MAAVSTSPPPTSATSTSQGNHHHHDYSSIDQSAPRPSTGHSVNSSASSPRRSVARKPLSISPNTAMNDGARIRDIAVSPVKVNFQPAAHWAEPSNADIEVTRSPSSQFGQLSETTSQGLASTLKGSSSGGTFDDSRVTPSNSGGSLPAAAATASASTSSVAMSPTERVRRQDLFRNSRESDETTASQQLASTASSAATSASSVSGPNDNADCTPNDDSPGSSVLDGKLPRQSVPLFQYHHQQVEQQEQEKQQQQQQQQRFAPPGRVNTAPLEQGRGSPTADPTDGPANIGRHLTPSQFLRRSSMPRPQSSYSAYSDNIPRGRSPNLTPGGSHMRVPSMSSRKSPDVRMSSYAELLNVPYSQQAPPVSIGLDNSNLRSVVGNNASLLSTQKTLDMYRANVKKTNDVSIQYSFAVFLISTAQEQGVDVSDPKARKASPQPPPLRDHDSPVIEAIATNPYELVREARQILQRLASGGYPFAQYYLADGYASGLFSKGKEDYNSAFPLFVLAAKHGHAESAYRAGLCYEFGWGCRSDPAKAVQFLRIGASKRHPGAMTRLGKACLSGDLGEKRYREGVKWMKLAAEAADAQYNSAPYQLGCLYETGYGDDVFRDPRYAAELFTQAADLGHPEANYRMGDAYEHGNLDCPRDPALSVHFYTGAAERGHAPAMMGLCAWYMVGAPPVLERDEEEAYEWARRSAELGKQSLFSLCSWCGPVVGPPRFARSKASDVRRLSAGL